MAVGHNCVLRDGLRQLRSAWRFATTAVCVTDAHTRVLRDGWPQPCAVWRWLLLCVILTFFVTLSFFVILSLTQNLRNGCESVGAELTDAESSSA